jgi:GT2 family glycosyltransferase
MSAITVIIPAYRAQATLPLVFGALEAQVLREDREVVLVDSTGDDDGTLIQRQWPWVQVISVPHRMLPGRARNLGASAARGELLAFLDADAIPQPGWLDELERAMEPRVEMVAGAVLNGTPHDRWGTVAYMLEFLEWEPERRVPLGHAASCSLLIRRAAFERAGGFPEDLWPGEDTVFSFPFATRHTLAFAPRARVAHLNRVNRRAVLAHQRRLGASWVQACARVPLPGSRYAVPQLAPVAVLARIWAVIRQLRRCPGRLRDVLGDAPLLVVALVAWGVGISQPAGATSHER